MTSTAASAVKWVVGIHVHADTGMVIMRTRPIKIHFLIGITMMLMSSV